MCKLEVSVIQSESLNAEDEKECNEISSVHLRVLCGSGFFTLSLHRQQERLLKGFRDPAQESGRIGAIDQAMIVGERKRQHLPGLEFAIHPDRLHAGTRKPENRDLGKIHNRRKSGAADTAQVRNRESTSL